MHFSNSIFLAAAAALLPATYAAPTPQNEDVSGMCRVHIRQSATNWIDSAEVFSPSGASISLSSSSYSGGGRASDGMSLHLDGYQWTVEISGGDSYMGEDQL